MASHALRCCTLFGSLLLSTSAGGQCLTTLFGSNGGGATGGAMFFDLTVAQPVLLTALEANFGAAVGAAVGIEVYVAPGTYVGIEGNFAAWTLAAVDDGAAVAAGFDQPTRLLLASPAVLAQGSYGVALVALSTGHRYTNGNGGNQQHTDGVLSTSHGAASSVPFSGTAFNPRVWNGSLCYSLDIGAGYCGPAAPNSTGASGRLFATGDASVAQNDVTLTALHLPGGQFGYALASRTQAFVANPGGAQGNLCLGGAIGRYVGHVFQVSPGGLAVSELDLTTTPTPHGPVSIGAGETWRFQVWHRDANPGSTSNFTDAVAIVFL